MVPLYFNILFFLITITTTTNSTCNFNLHQINLLIDQTSWNTMQTNPNLVDSFGNNANYSCQVFINGFFFPGAVVQVHGASSRGYVKKSYRLDFSSPYVPRENFWNYTNTIDVLKSVILNAGWDDQSWLRQKLVADMTMIIGGLSPRIVFCEFYVNGDYYGFYQFEEHINSAYFANNGLGSSGYYYKAISHDSNWSMKNPVTDGYDTSNGLAPNFDDLNGLYVALNSAYSSVDVNYWKLNVQPVFQITDWIIYSLMHVYANDYDAFDKNYYLFNPGTGQFRLAMWDADATWGNNWDGTPLNGLPKLMGSFNSDGTDYLSPHLFAVDKHWQAYLLLFQSLLNTSGLLDPSSISSWLINMQSCIIQPALRDDLKWPNKIGSCAFQCAIEYINSTVITRHSVVSNLVSQSLAIISNPDNLWFKDEWGLPFFSKDRKRTQTLSPQPTVVINELSGYSSISDYVELYNPTPSTINLTGIWLGENQNLTKTLITQNIVVPSLGYVVLQETDMGFGLNSKGDLFMIHSNDGTPIASLTYNPFIYGQSFCRFVNSDGVVNYPMCSQTQGTQNGYPNTPPLVISEIMYTDSVHYIKLVSVVNESTPLFYSNYTWGIRGVASFDFPVGVVVPARTSVYIINGDSLNFTLSNNLPPEYQIFEGLVSYLNNTQGGGITLEVPFQDISSSSKKKSPPNTPVDMVDYGSTPSWPVPPIGQSITRLSLMSFGNEPSNWGVSLFSCSSPDGSDCPFIDACTVAQCVDLACQWSLRTCTGNETTRESFRTCFPDILCPVYVPPLDIPIPSPGTGGTTAPQEGGEPDVSPVTLPESQTEPTGKPIPVPGSMSMVPQVANPLDNDNDSPLGVQPWVWGVIGGGVGLLIIIIVIIVIIIVVVKKSSEIV